MSSNLSYLNRSQFLASFNQNQPFSLPDSIIHYISRNPLTAKLYQKMIQSCKYFFVKNPILVISDIYFTDRWWAQFYGKWIKMDLNISSRKLWITERLCLFQPEDKNVLSSIFENIYRFDAKELKLSNQIISNEQLLLLSSNVEKLQFSQVTVKYKDGLVVPFGKIIEFFPKIKSLDYSASDPSNISSQTFKELLKIPQFLTLDECEMWEIPEEFDLEYFYIYMKKNTQTKFELNFSSPLSEVYKNRLEEIIDEIIEDENHDYKPPYIYFPGMNYLKSNKLKNIFYCS